jgi:hypothetical protein
MNDQKSVLEHLVGILESIDNDLILPLKMHEKENKGGFFSISRQVFCYVDYLGALAKNGKSTSKNELVEDLKNSVVHLIRDLEFDKRYMTAAKDNLQKMSQVVTLDQKPNSTLFAEAKEIVEQAAGVIDNDLQVIRSFKNSSEYEAYRREEWGL